MAKEASFSPDAAGMRALTQSSDLGDMCVAAANAGKAYAESIAPVGETGDYAASFVVEQVDVSVPGQWGGLRAGAVLYNKSPHSHLVEYRNGSRVLQRTAAWIDGAFR